MSLADFKGFSLAPHFAMEIHLHLAAAYPREPWLEHFEWLEPMFNERPSCATAACMCRIVRAWASV